MGEHQLVSAIQHASAREEQEGPATRKLNQLIHLASDGFHVVIRAWTVGGSGEIARQIEESIALVVESEREDALQHLGTFGGIEAGTAAEIGEVGALLIRVGRVGADSGQRS